MQKHIQINVNAPLFGKGWETFDKRGEVSTWDIIVNRPFRKSIVARASYKVNLWRHATAKDTLQRTSSHS